MPSQTYTIFSEVPASPEILPSPLEETEFDIPLMDTQCSLDSLPQEEPNPWCLQQPATPAAPSSAELKRRFDEYINPDFSNALDIDKSYVPQPRKRKAGRYTMCLFFAYLSCAPKQLTLKHSSLPFRSTRRSTEFLCLLQPGRPISSYLFGIIYPAGLGNKNLLQSKPCRTKANRTSGAKSD